MKWGEFLLQCNFFKMTPLSFENNQIADSLAFDGCYYYVTIPCSCTVVKYDMCFCKKECIHTYREYSSICYDCTNNCFWASSNCNYGYIYKLNRCFKEIDSIYLGYKFSGNITGLSYDCLNNSLLISISEYILKLPENSNNPIVILKLSQCFINSVSVINDGIIITAIRNGKQYIYIYDNSLALVGTSIIPNCYLLQDIIALPCENAYYALTIKNSCYSYVVPIIAKDCTENVFLKFYDECSEMDIPYWEICDCLEEYFCKNCKNCCENDCCNDILCSIARMECALANIINAEGKKLQKVLSITDDLNDIICTNKEINKTLINVTNIEGILLGKLSAIDDCCCLCDCNCDCDCDCKNNFASFFEKGSLNLQ